MDVELRELRWAIVASQHRSLRQAADALNVRQSTLSRQLRQLEYKLGAALFERTNGGTDQRRMCVGCVIGDYGKRTAVGSLLIV